MSFYKLIVLFVHLTQKIQFYFLKTCKSRVKKEICKIFAKCKIKVNGDSPWDIKVQNEDFYCRMATYGTLGLAESYIENWITCEDLDEFCYRMAKYSLYKEQTGSLMQRIYSFFIYKICNLQSKEKAYEIGESHYDLGNDLFETFLDKSMTYSCGYWRNAKNLEEAQLHKMDLIARKLKLEPNMRVLDISCGWGGLAKYLAEKYNVEVVGVTVSKEGAKLAEERCKGLPVDIRACDYRDVDEKFDRIVSVGMFEHVGEKNYREYFEMVHRCLTDNGLFLLHTIGVNHVGMYLNDDFFHKHIFRNGELPYYQAIALHTENLLILEDWANIGYYYYNTLISWNKNFQNNFEKISYKGEKFKRLWTFYLMLCAGSFKARKTQVWQVVFSKDGLPGGYEAVR